MRRLLPALAVVATALFAAPAAFAASYDVLGTADASGSCTQIFPSAFQCPTLRAAVDASNASPDEDDGIIVHAGTYVLSLGTLPISDNVTILSDGTARTTIFQGNGTTRVIAITGAAQVGLQSITVQGGRAVSADGGNISVGAGAALSMILSRVTDGRANIGAGIANQGQLSVFNSLIDGNIASTAGGGIYNDGSLGAATVSVANSTIAGNQAAEFGGAIASEGNTGNDVSLIFATVGRNSSSGGAVRLNGPQTISAQDSIIASNPGGNNCIGTSFSSSESNLEDGTSCGFGPANDPQLDGGLTNQGGPTDVLTIPAGSPAIDFVPQCFIGIDQRGYTRNTTLAPCDAGAYELSGTAPGGEQPPVQTPTPTSPQPTPTATPAPTAPPVANRSVEVEPEGTVLIKRNGKFVPLTDGVVPNGAEIDTKKGEVTITTSQGEKAKFFDGIFKVSQTRNVTTLTLSEPLDCKKAKTGKALAAAKKPKSRKLWGDGKGKFRTKGAYSAATIRGTKWLVTDSCTTTTTRVTTGTVQVEDFANPKKKILVRKGKPYVARPKKR